MNKFYEITCAKASPAAASAFLENCANFCSASSNLSCTALHFSSHYVIKRVLLKNYCKDTLSKKYNKGKKYYLWKFQIPFKLA